MLTNLRLRAEDWQVYFIRTSSLRDITLNQGNQTDLAMDGMGVRYVPLNGPLPSSNAVAEGSAMLRRKLYDSQEKDDAASARADKFSEIGTFWGTAYRGAVSSSLQALALAPAGPYGIAAGFGIGEAERASHVADDAGLKGMDKLRFVALEGLIEGGIEAAFQKIGMGGMESFITGGAKAAGSKAAKAAALEWLRTGKELAVPQVTALLKETGIATLHELPGEVLTEIAHNVNQALHGVDPDAMTFERLLETVAQTTAQTLLTMGLLGSIKLPGAVINDAHRLLKREPLTFGGGKISVIQDLNTGLLNVTNADGKVVFSGLEDASAAIAVAESLSTRTHQLYSDAATPEKVAADKAYMLGNPVLAVKQGTVPRFSGFSQLRTFLVGEWQKLTDNKEKTAVDSEALGEVKVDNRAVKNILGHPLPGLLDCLLAVPAVVKTGRLLHTTADSHNVEGSTVHFIGAPVTIGEQRTMVIAMVRDDANGQRPYVADAIVVDDLADKKVVDAGEKPGASVERPAKQRPHDGRNGPVEIGNIADVLLGRQPRNQPPPPARTRNVPSSPVSPVSPVSPTPSRPGQKPGFIYLGGAVDAAASGYHAAVSQFIDAAHDLHRFQRRMAEAGVTPADSGSDPSSFLTRFRRGTDATVSTFLDGPVSDTNGNVIEDSEGKPIVGLNEAFKGLDKSTRQSLVDFLLNTQIAGELAERLDTRGLNPEDMVYYRYHLDWLQRHATPQLLERAALIYRWNQGILIHAGLNGNIESRGTAPADFSGEGETFDAAAYVRESGQIPLWDMEFSTPQTGKRISEHLIGADKPIFHPVDSTIKQAGIQILKARLYQQLVRQGGKTLAPITKEAARTAFAETRTQLNDWVTNGVTDIHGNRISPPLRRALDGLDTPEREHAFNEYLHARRTLALAGRHGDGRASGMDIETARAIVAREKASDFYDRAQIVHDWNRAILDYLIGTDGIRGDNFFGEEVSKIRTVDPGSYIPLWRSAEPYQRLNTDPKRGKEVEGTEEGEPEGDSPDAITQSFEDIIESRTWAPGESINDFLREVTEGVRMSPDIRTDALTPETFFNQQVAAARDFVRRTREKQIVDSVIDLATEAPEAAEPYIREANESDIRRPAHRTPEKHITGRPIPGETRMTAPNLNPNLAADVAAALVTDPATKSVKRRGHIVDFSDTPSVLQFVGMPDAHIISDAQRVRKMGSEHGLSPEIISSLPSEYSSPVSVFKEDNGYMVVTSLMSKNSEGNMAPVGVFLEPHKSGGEQTFLASAYPFEPSKCDHYRKAARGDSLLYVDESKAAHLFEEGTQFPITTSDGKRPTTPQDFQNWLQSQAASGATAHADSTNIYNEFMTPISEGIDGSVLYALKNGKWYAMDKSLVEAIDSVNAQVPTLATAAFKTALTDIQNGRVLAATAHTAQGVGAATLSTLRLSASFFRAAATAWNPRFGLGTNVIRDFETLTYNTRTGAMPLRVWRNWMASLVSGALDAASLGHLQLGKTAEYRALFDRLGLQLSGSLTQDSAPLKLAVDKGLGKTNVRTLANGVWDALIHALQFPESAARVAEMRTVAEKHGWEPSQPLTPQIANELAAAAKQVTTDFTRAGKLAEKWNRIVPFLNAGIQGKVSAYEAFKRNPVQWLCTRALGVTLLAAIEWLINKDEPFWQQMSPQQKLSYRYIRIDSAASRLSGAIRGNLAPAQSSGVPLSEQIYLQLPTAFETDLLFRGLTISILDAVHGSGDRESLTDYFQILFEQSQPFLSLDGLLDKPPESARTPLVPPSPPQSSVLPIHGQNPAPGTASRQNGTASAVGAHTQVRPVSPAPEGQNVSNPRLQAGAAASQDAAKIAMPSNASQAPSYLPSPETLWRIGSTINHDSLPPFLREAWAQLFNEDKYWKRPIVSPALEDDEPEEQTGLYTTKLAQTLGQKLGWSPLRIDHALKSQYAGMGDFFSGAIGGRVGIEGEDYIPREPEPASWLFGMGAALFRREGGIPDPHTSKSIRKLYDLAGETFRAWDARNLAASQSQAAKDGETQGAAAPQQNQQGGTSAVGADLRDRPASPAALSRTGQPFINPRLQAEEQGGTASAKIAMPSNASQAPSAPASPRDAASDASLRVEMVAMANAVKAVSTALALTRHVPRAEREILIATAIEISDDAIAHHERGTLAHRTAFYRQTFRHHSRQLAKHRPPAQNPPPATPSKPAPSKDEKPK